MRQPALLALILFLLIPAAVVAQTSDHADDDEVLVRVNGSDTIEAGEELSVAVVVRGDLDIFGNVEDVAVVVEGDLSIRDGATIDGELVVVDGTLTLRDGSTVDGDIYLSNDAEWVVEDGAVFRGSVHQGDLSPNLDRDVAWRIVLVTLAAWFGSTLIAIVAALVFSGIGGRQLWTSAGNLSARPGITILTALAFWFGLVLLVIPAILSVVAILALPFIAMIAFAVWFLGYVTFGTRLGALITGQRFSDDAIDHPYLASIAGTVVLQLVGLIAIGGALGFWIDRLVR